MALVMPQDIAQVLAELEMLSQGTTMNYGGPVTRGTGDGVPAPVHPPYLRYREWWVRVAGDEEAERRVLDAARFELESWRRSPRPMEPETLGALERRIVVEGDGMTVEECARAFYAKPGFVRQARARAGRVVVNGKDPVVLVADGVDVARLAAGGLTERQIAMFAKVGKSTVRRLLGRPA